MLFEEQNWIQIVRMQKTGGIEVERCDVMWCEVTNIIGEAGLRVGDQW